jgi:Protein of unknown function (DUF4238)
MQHKNRKKTQKTKKQHYSPKFFLERFRAPDGNFWILDLNSAGAAEPERNIKRVCMGLRFYDHPRVDADFGEFQATEKTLSRIESAVAVNVANALDAISLNNLPAPEDVIGVLHFFVLQSIRTPTARKFLQELILADRDHQKDAKLAQAGLIHNPLTYQKNLTGLLDARIFFVRNDSKTPFVTSDNPVAAHPWVNQGVRYLGHENACAFLALSPTVGMVILGDKHITVSDRSVRVSLLSTVSEADVQYANNLTALNAQNVVIGPCRNFPDLELARDRGDLRLRGFQFTTDPEFERGILLFRGIGKLLLRGAIAQTLGALQRPGVTIRYPIFAEAFQLAEKQGFVKPRKLV